MFNTPITRVPVQDGAPTLCDQVGPVELFSDVGCSLEFARWLHHNYADQIWNLNHGYTQA